MTHPPEPPSNIDAAKRTMRHLRNVKDTPRQIRLGAQLATAIAYLATLLTVPALDRPLQVAVVALAAAIPMLSQSLYLSSLRPDRKTPKRHMATFLVMSAWIIEPLGQGVFGVAFLALLKHFGDLPFWVAIGSTVGFGVLWGIVTVVYGIIVIVQDVRKQKKQQKGTNQ